MKPDGSLMLVQFFETTPDDEGFATLSVTMLQDIDVTADSPLEFDPDVVIDTPASEEE